MPYAAASWPGSRPPVSGLAPAGAFGLGQVFSGAGITRTMASAPAAVVPSATSAAIAASQQRITSVSLSGGGAVVRIWSSLAQSDKVATYGSAR